MVLVNVVHTAWFLAFTGCVLWAKVTSAFSNDRNDNLAVYWGQDSAGQQQRLGFYCNDETIDVIPLAFLYIFFGQGGQPVIDFANICSTGSGTFPGTDLADCSFLASDIKQCQAKGKIVTLSLGGATSQVGFSSDSQATGFAETIWNMFLGGNGGIRPFGSAVLDGVDLDIESGSSAHYGTFVNSLRSLAKNAPKRYYITAAPQCPFPDAEVGNALNSAFFDAVYVQFYNNYCETSAPSEFNFATWDHWAKTQSPNPDVKVYLGAPASAQAAGNGFVQSNTLVGVSLDAQKRYSSFGGVMLWDADTAYTNNRYHISVKNAISDRSGAPPRDPPTQNPIPTLIPATTAGSSRGGLATQTVVSASSLSSYRDPRATARVKRPSFTLDLRNDITPTATSIVRARSRLFHL
ncbi:glycoside hydrolase superfamily [Crassisporium funariophilum]|nr:glycoside hydrolase superfamily [Crassisporium funariophilum]